MNFHELDLAPELVKAIDAMGFDTPTPIQAAAIPEALSGKDILGSAQTGSGKTVAFALPLLNHLLKHPSAKSSHEVHAVVLTPVRELAAQVEATFKDCGQFTKLDPTLIIGGASWNKQVEDLQKGAEIVVATPGRLLDHLRNNRKFHLDACDILVLDEADRMLDMGFLPDVRAILERIPTKRQTLMFSATVPMEIESIVQKFMREPVRVKIDPPHKPAEGITQKVYPITDGQKYDLLQALIERNKIESGLVFTATKRRADVVERFLKYKGISAAAMHSDLPQGKRTRVLQDFRDQKIRILVATDIAARGLDIRSVSHVINYDVPTYPEDYLHRIGRTARAFTVGDAMTLMGPQEKTFIESIERFLKLQIERVALDNFKYDVPPKLDAYKASISSKFRTKRRSLKGRRRLF
jgi:ATP-dependent RNA helicase RhlE